MAANTPVIHTLTGQTGVRLDEIFQAIASAYAGAGSFRGRWWQVSATNSFPAAAANVKFDTKNRAADSQTQGEQWIEIPLGMLALSVNTIYYISCMDTNTSSESSSWATAISFTTYNDPYTGAVFAAGQ